MLFVTEVTGNLRPRHGAVTQSPQAPRTYPVAFETWTQKTTDVLRVKRLLLGASVGMSIVVGGIAFMVLTSSQAAAGVWNDRLIARLGPDEGEAALREPHVRAFDIIGRPMRNWVAVEPGGVEDDEQLKDWIERATKFVKALPKK